MSRTSNALTAPESTAPSTSLLGEDLVWGVAAIAAEINRTTRQTFHLLENGRLPAKKIGGRWVSSKSKLRAHFTALIDAEVA